MRTNSKVEAFEIKTTPINELLKNHLYKEAQAWASDRWFKLPDIAEWDCWTDGSDFAIICHRKEQFTSHHHIKEMSYIVYWSQGNNECIFYKAEGYVGQPWEVYHDDYGEDDYESVRDYL